MLAKIYKRMKRKASKGVEIQLDVDSMETLKEAEVEAEAEVEGEEEVEEDQ